MDLRRCLIYRNSEHDVVCQLQMETRWLGVTVHARAPYWRYVQLPDHVQLLTVEYFVPIEI